MKRMLNLTMTLSLTAMSGLTGACMAQLSSRDVEAGSIYGDYELSAEEGSDSLHAEATFYANGSQNGTGTVYVNLDDGAAVDFDGSEMSEDSESISNSVKYVAQASGASARASSHSFTFTNKDGQVYTNSVPGPREFHFTQDFPDEVSPDTEVVMNWVGEAATSDETLSVNVSVQSDDGSSSSWASFGGGAMSGSSGQVRIQLSSQGITGPARATLTACRSRHGLPTSSPSEGGRWSSEYCLQPQSFRILAN